MKDPRSRIPSVDALVEAEETRSLIELYGRDRVVGAIRAAVEEVRSKVAASLRGAGSDGWGEAVEAVATYLGRAATSLEAGEIPNLRRVINVTGVVLHTNLGRAPLAAAAVDAMRAAASEYSNLEFDLSTGRRGSRYTHCVSLLTELTGAEDALVVNNAAGALVLAVSTTAWGGGVAVSRGELVEIGGGFRIPEVLERAGARLVEVGSTNRTRLADYEEALVSGEVVAMLKVHRSNFRLTGFTEEATPDELAGLAEHRGVPLVHDLGSGLMMDAEALGLPHEPRAQHSLVAGSNAVVVSGDKLLGGPQAGIIVGDAAWVSRMRGNPICRALRVDKVTLAGLEATLRIYRDPARARDEIPTLRMLAAEASSLEQRARALCDRIVSAGVAAAVVPTEGAVGGGTFPGVELPSHAVELAVEARVDALASALREGDPPVVGRIVDDRLLLDVRTLLPGQDDDLVRRIAESAAPIGEAGGS